MDLKMNNLREVRKRLKISQYRLSKLSNVSQGLLSQYERGLLSPSLERSKEIFIALKKEDENLSFLELWNIQ